jgi:hypothetical protein
MREKRIVPRTSSVWGLIALACASGVVLAQSSEVLRQWWDEDAMVNLEGTVTSLEWPLATLDVEGDGYTVHLGPSSYWDWRGYHVSRGDRVTITGHLTREGGRPHVYLCSMARDGKRFSFVDSEGVPYWLHRRGPYYDDTGWPSHCRGWRGCGHHHYHHHHGCCP